MEDLLKIIAQTKFPAAGIIREQYLKKIEPWLLRPEIIILKGVRRSGKSTILQQLASRLKQKAVYINFDDYRLLGNLDIDLLEMIVKAFPDISYFFFDEIQKIPGFESWLRTYYDIKSHKKFIISGSNISLLSPSLGTTLTGRNITFEIFPLDYQEFMKFSTGDMEDYLIYGGFPEVVLEPDVKKKKDLLIQYFNDILLRDIFDRYAITSTQQFKALAQYILSNTGLKISANKLAKELGINSHSAEKYLSYLVDAYLIFEVPFFSHSAKTKYFAGRASKYYALDNGLVTALSIKLNRGHLFEAIVGLSLRKRTHIQLYYWSGKKEVDFISGNQAFQVSLTSVEKTAFDELQRTHKHIKETFAITLRSIKGFLENEASG